LVRMTFWAAKRLNRAPEGFCAPGMGILENGRTLVSEVRRSPKHNKLYNLLILCKLLKDLVMRDGLIQRRSRGPTFGLRR
jgi:hypothetical protein